MGQNKRVIAAAQQSLIETAQRTLALLPSGEMPPVPDFLRITPEVEQQRIAARASTPVRAMPRFDERTPEREEGEDTKALRRSLEELTQAENVPPLPIPTSKRPPRPSRDGMTSVADIALSLNVDPRLARQALRSVKEPKPPQGWAYTPADVDRIRALIKTTLDQPRTPRSATPRTPKKSKPILPPPAETTFSGNPKDKAKWTRYHNKQDAIRESIASKRLTAKPGTSSSLSFTKDASSAGIKNPTKKLSHTKKPVASPTKTSRPSAARKQK